MSTPVPTHINEQCWIVVLGQVAAMEFCVAFRPHIRNVDVADSLSRECMDAETNAKLLEIATEYREMLNGKAPADAEDRSIAC